MDRKHEMRDPRKEDGEMKTWQERGTLTSVVLSVRVHNDDDV